MRRLVLLLPLLLLAGCVTPMVDYKAMTPEQIKELVRDKSAAGTCLVANTPYGKGITTYFAIDAKVLQAGGTMTITDQCQMTFSNGGPADRFR